MKYLLVLASLLAIGVRSDDPPKGDDDKKKKDKPAEKATKLAGLGEPCTSDKSDKGCKENHRCGKLKTDDKDSQKIYDAAGELCYKSEDCGKEEKGVSLECGAIQLTSAAVLGAIVMAYYI